MNGFDPRRSLPDAPCERRKRMALSELEPLEHKIHRDPDMDVKALLEQGDYQHVIDLYFAYDRSQTAKGANNLGCAYALGDDLEQAWHWLRVAADQLGKPYAKACIRRNLRRILVARVAAR